MMALQDLLAAIEAEAAADIVRLRGERHREAAAIFADAQRQAGELERAAVSAAEKEEREAAELRLMAARQEIAGRLRDAYEAAYQQIALDARARLRTVRERSDYPVILASLLDEARSALPASTFVRVDPADEPLIRRLLGGEDRLRIEATLRCAGGIEVAGGAGASVRNTVEERLTAAEPALRALTGRLLRPGPDGDPRAGTQSEEVPA
jgi:vacuolar-type H+-ATPase subunit E/Vma4